MQAAIVRFYDGGDLKIQEFKDLLAEKSEKSALRYSAGCHSSTQKVVGMGWREIRNENESYNVLLIDSVQTSGGYPLSHQG